MSDVRPELLAALGELYSVDGIETLPGDASSRRFHRIALADGATRIVMDYGAPFMGETDDVRLARIFESAVLPVARVMDVLPEAGAIVLEDLGDLTLETALTRNESRESLYGDAVRLAVAIAERGTPALSASARASGPALDGERFCFEMDFFLRHYVGDFLGHAERGESLRQPLYELARTLAAHPRVLCHRDFHSRNIMVRAGGSLAMVDIQDARWGPDTYDAASLLHDAYVDIGVGESDDFFDLFKGTLTRTVDIESMRTRYEVASTQRMIKALGTFGYQIAVLGRPRYREAADRTVSRLSRLLPTWRIVAPLGEGLFRAGILKR